MHPTARTPRVIRSVELSASAHGGNEIHNPSNTQYVPNSAADQTRLVEGGVMMGWVRLEFPDP